MHYQRLQLKTERFAREWKLTENGAKPDVTPTGGCNAMVVVISKSAGNPNFVQILSDCMSTLVSHKYPDQLIMIRSFKLILIKP